MSSEYRFVTLRRRAEELIPANTGDTLSQTLDIAGSDPQLAEQMDGWTLVNSQFVPLNEQEVLIVLTLTAKVTIPEGGNFWGE